MYLFDLLVLLPKGIMIRIKFDGTPTEFCFTTGARTTGRKIGELANRGRSSAMVNEIIPLWHAQELYIHCC